MAGLTMAPLTREEIHKHTVMFSISRAWTLGNAVKMAQNEKQCPVKAILDSQNGKLLITGKVHRSYSTNYTLVHVDIYYI